jgi:hypothetical protein
LELKFQWFGRDHGNIVQRPLSSFQGKVNLGTLNKDPWEIGKSFHQEIHISLVGSFVQFLLLQKEKIY